MMEALDLSSFVDENLSSEVLAYEHALDLTYLFVEAMEREGLSCKQLAERMGIHPSRLSKLLNTQANMTLETIARFELALDMRLIFSFSSCTEDTFEVEMPAGQSSSLPEGLETRSELETRVVTIEVDANEGKIASGCKKSMPSGMRLAA